MYEVYKEAIMGKRTQIRQTDKRTGRVYVYETEYRYDKVKKRTVLANRKLVGHVDPDTGEVVPNRTTKPYASAPTSKREFYGASYLFDKIAETCGITADIECAAPGRGDVVLSIVYYLLSEDSCPLSRFGRWARTHWHPFGQDVPSQRSSELFASLDTAVKDRFCSLQARRRNEDGYWFYDSTSISSWSETLSHVRWGRNKDHVPLAQINVGCLVGETTGLPFYFRHYAGNISDVATIEKLIDDVAYMECGRAKLACDRGFWSAANINRMMARHMKFLIGAKTGLAFVAKSLAKNASALRQWQNYDSDKGVFCMTVPHSWGFEQSHPRTGKVEKSSRRTYLHLYYSPQRVAEDEAKLSSLLKSLDSELGCGNRVDGHEGLYDRYFERSRGGKYVGRTDVIDTERAQFGYFALFGNDAALSAQAALEVYRNKDMVEKCFADVKGRLDFRTPKVSSPETLNGKLLCMFIALIITSWLKQAMKNGGLDKDWTMESLIDELDVIERYTHPGKTPKVMEVTDKQMKIYEALGIKPPKPR
jgi:transposase